MTEEEKIEKVAWAGFCKYAEPKIPYRWPSKIVPPFVPRDPFGGAYSEDGWIVLARAMLKKWEELNEEYRW